MKTKLFILTMGVMLLGLVVSAGTKDTKALTGNSLTDFGKYTITVSDVPMVFDNQTLPTYNLTYENSDETVKIGLVQEEKCVTFIVCTDDFEIAYTCNSGVFGVKRIDSKYQKISKEEMDGKINRSNYLSQRVICTNKKPQDELLGLIACYLPQLMSDNFQANL